MRQATDVQGAVTAAREWTPYGVEVGGAQPGLGYAGEWFDADVEAQYLRARWYAPEDAIFVSRDPIESEPPYQYVRGNPINFVDPSGLCAQFGNSTDCERFVAEVQLIIDTVKEERACTPILKSISDASLVIDLLAYYYSGIPITWGGFTTRHTTRNNI